MEESSTAQQQPDGPEGPLVTALIVSHNSGEALRRCVAALEASHGREQLEILVVDQGSRDGSATIDEEFPGITPLRLPKHFGMTKARNIGVRTAKGEYLLFLAPEVTVKPETAITLAQRMQADSTIGPVAPILTDNTGKPLPQIVAFPTAGDLAAWAKSGVPFRAANAGPVECLSIRALMVRRQTIVGMNYFDERFGESWSDVEMCFRVRRGGKNALVFSDLSVTDDGEPAAASGWTGALEADRRLGAVAFAGKHFSRGSQIGLYLSQLLGSLGSPGGFGAFSRMMSGQKVDGTEQFD
ncbi:MAG: glycosyltransferase [Acidobacteriota bacterium]